jgi:anti-sigma B factor antagonist
MHQLGRVEWEDRSGVRVIRILGEVDVTNVRQLADAVGDAVPNHASIVALDLSATAYLDSVGIQLLFTFAERMADRRRQLRLVVPAGAPIRSVLELTAVTATIPVFETVDEAAAADG